MLVALVFGVIFIFMMLNIGTFMNGTVGSSLIETYPESSNRTELDNQTITTLGTIADGYDDTVDITIVAAIISVITAPLFILAAIRRVF